MTVSMRGYQIKLVTAIRAAYAGQPNPDIRHRDGHSGRSDSVLVVLPTGGGKTYTFVYIAEQAAQRNNRVLIIAHRKELIKQASLSLASLGVQHQVVAPVNKRAEIRRAHVEKYGQPYTRNGASVAVASVQTLVRRESWLREFKPALLIVDEAHHSTAGQWRKIIEAVPDAKLLGVTATPCRTDGQGLGDIYQSMVLGPQMGELIEMGNLVPPRIFSPPMRADLSGCHRRGGDLNPNEQAEQFDRPDITGDAVEHYEKLAPGRPAIVFCCNVAHAEHVCDQFRSRGWNFRVVVGSMDDTERDAGINGLADGSVHGIVTVDVVSEGTDIPVAEVAILLRRTESESLILQQCGRVLRPADGKESGLILDHAGNFNPVDGHAPPHYDRDWSLDSDKRSRKKSDSGPPVKQCLECYAVHSPAPACPACGYVYKIETREMTVADGELVEMTANDAEMQRIQARRAQGAARDVKSLMAQGMSMGRARNIIAARAEKERLQQELADLVMQSGENLPVSEIRKMKPKQLRSEIDRISLLLFGAA